MQADIAAITKDMGDITITWNGEDYVCVPSSTNVEGDLGVGGFNEQVDRAVTVAKDLFTDEVYPKQMESLTLDSKEYRIQKVITNGNDAFLRLLLVDKNLNM